MYKNHNVTIKKNKSTTLEDTQSAFMVACLKMSKNKNNLDNISTENLSYMGKSKSTARHTRIQS